MHRCPASRPCPCSPPSEIGRRVVPTILLSELFIRNIVCNPTTIVAPICSIGTLCRARVVTLIVIFPVIVIVILGTCICVLAGIFVLGYTVFGFSARPVIGIILLEKLLKRGIIVILP